MMLYRLSSCLYLIKGINAFAFQRAVQNFTAELCLADGAFWGLALSQAQHLTLKLAANYLESESILKRD